MVLKEMGNKLKRFGHYISHAQSIKYSSFDPNCKDPTCSWLPMDFKLIDLELAGGLSQQRRRELQELKGRKFLYMSRNPKHTGEVE